MRFAKILIVPLVLIVFSVGGIFVFAKVIFPKNNMLNNSLVARSPKSSASPLSLATTVPAAPNLKECGATNANQNGNGHDDCYWGSSEFLSPTYKSGK